MANGVNKVIVIGNLGRDPEMRTTKSGSPVCNMRLAVNERRRNGETWEDHVEWISVAAFGRTAENCGTYLAKGRPVYVEGRMQTRSWEADGIKKERTEVVANIVHFLGSKSDGAPANGHSQSQQRPPRGQAEGFFDDDLPL